MTLCSFPMDLSSLEGPPIHNPRLTMSIPQIHLDHALFTTPYPESMPMPDPDFEFQHRLRASYPAQRSTSADALPRRKHPHQRQRRNQPSLTLDTNTSRHSYTPTPTARHSYTPPTSYSNTLAPNHHHHHHHHHHPTHRQTHAPRRLTWIESESIWRITSAEASPSSPSSTWGDVNWAATRSRPPVLTHSRSMDLSLAQAQRSTQRCNPVPRVPHQQAEEVPPPYERHYFDRPLGGQLLGVEGDASIPTSASFNPSGSLNVDVGLAGERRNRDRDGVAGRPRPSSVGESRWTEIGRRMNRSPGG